MRAKLMFGVICVLCATAFAGCQPSQPADAPAADPAPQAFVAPEPAPQPAPQVASKPAAKPAPKKPVAKADVKMPAASAAADAAAPREADPSPASTPAIESRQVSAREEADLVITTTMSGCLIRDDGMFRLKDTNGDHAPKSRSWKSGFIRRSSARVDVIDASNRLKLGSFVGRRVTLSGTLDDREMHARSLRASSDRCD